MTRDHFSEFAWLPCPGRRCTGSRRTGSSRLDIFNPALKRRSELARIHGVPPSTTSPGHTRQLGQFFFAGHRDAIVPPFFVPQAAAGDGLADAPPSQFNLPPSTSVFMFCSACMNLIRRLSLSAARAASSGSIELSKNSV
jgi:hypothetical protein